MKQHRFVIPAVIFLAFTAPIAQVAAEGRGAGRIVFEHAPDGVLPGPTTDIYAVNSDGTHLQALTNDGHSHDPSWSPDGHQILYLHDMLWPSDLPRSRIRVDREWASHLFEELYVMASDGRDAHLLRRLDGRFSGSTACSPDGKTLAISYYAYSDENHGGPHETPFDLFTVALDAQGSPRLLLRRSMEAAWSPDGYELAFSEQIPGAGWAVAIANADGSHVVQLTDPYGYLKSPYIQFAGSPAWSPDGKEIAFDAEFRLFASWQSPTVEEHQIFLILADGSHRRQLTTDPDWECFHPSWSPDGTEIAFSCTRIRPLNACSWGGEGPESSAWSRPCVRRIFVLRIDDPNAKPIQVTNIDGARPAFSPAP